MATESVNHPQNADHEGRGLVVRQVGGVFVLFAVSVFFWSAVAYLAGVWTVGGLWGARLAVLIAGVGLVLVVAGLFISATRGWSVLRRGWALLGVGVVVDIAAVIAFVQGLIPLLVGDRVTLVAEAVAVVGAALVLFGLIRWVWCWVMDDPSAQFGEHRFCPWCGTPIVARQPSCPSCGTNLSGSAPPSTGGKAGAGTKQVAVWTVSGAIGLLVVVLMLVSSPEWLSPVRHLMPGDGSTTETQAGGSRGAARSTATSVVTDPCMGYDDWGAQLNMRMLRMAEWFQQTPPALQGTKSEMQTQVAASAQDDIAQLDAVIAWLEQSTAPPAAAEYQRLTLEQFKIQRRIFLANTFEAQEEIRSKEFIPVARQADEAKDKMLDACFV